MSPRTGSAAIIAAVVVVVAAGGAYMASPSLQAKVASGDFTAISMDDVLSGSDGSKYCQAATTMVSAAAKDDGETAMDQLYGGIFQDRFADNLPWDAQTLVETYRDRYHVDPGTVSCVGVRDVTDTNMAQSMLKDYREDQGSDRAIKYKAFKVVGLSYHVSEHERLGQTVEAGTKKRGFLILEAESGGYYLDPSGTRQTYDLGFNPEALPDRYT
jgi:hypothetical protein